MTKFNISQAAKNFDKDRSTIQRHIKQGKLSYDIDRVGHKVIDLTELIRAYGEPKHTAADTAVPPSKAMPQHAAPHTAAVFEEKIKGLEKQVEGLEQDQEERKERESELRKEIERQLSIIDRQTLLIEDKREKAEDKPNKVPKFVKMAATYTAAVLSAAFVVLVVLRGALYYFFGS